MTTTQDLILATYHYLIIAMIPIVFMIFKYKNAIKMLRLRVRVAQRVKKILTMQTVLTIIAFSVVAAIYYMNFKIGEQSHGPLFLTTKNLVSYVNDFTGQALMIKLVSALTLVLNSILAFKAKAILKNSK